MSLLNSIILYSIAYSLVFSIVAYAIYPPSQFVAEVKPIEEIQQKTESMYRGVMGVPILELGGLLWHTGNIIIDFVLNFITALPSTATLLLSVFFTFAPIDPNLQQQVKVGIFSLLTIMLVIALIRMLIGIRRGVVP